MGLDIMAKNIGKPKPEWADVGEKVFVASGANRTELTEAQVVRHTASRIYTILNDGTEVKFFRPKYARQWEEVGGRQGFKEARALLNPQDPKITRVDTPGRIRSIQVAAHTVAEKLTSDATALEIMAASDTLRELALTMAQLEKEQT